MRGRASAVADLQRGRAARAQLLAAGISPSTVKRMVASGFMVTEHAGVYVVGHSAHVDLGRETGALLACGDGVVDNGDFTDRELERALDEALVQNIVRPNQVIDTLDRLPGRRAKRLRELINERQHSTLTRSELEELFLELIRQASLPQPRVNARLHGFEVDFYWPEHRVVFELDGYRFHSTKSAFENDHRKDAVLKQAGIDVNRLTWRQVTGERLATVALVAQRLATAERSAA